MWDWKQHMPARNPDGFMDALLKRPEMHPDSRVEGGHMRD